jgi:large subunit ribosomal protein L29
MSEEELEYRLKELKEELFNLRFQHATGQLDNPMKLKETRRDIARVCTVITEREYAIHAEAFEEAIRAPRETVEEPEELIEAETEDELAEDAEALFEQEELAPESEEQLEEEVEEELKDL